MSWPLERGVLGVEDPVEAVWRLIGGKEWLPIAAFPFPNTLLGFWSECWNGEIELEEGWSSYNHKIKLIFRCNLNKVIKASGSNSTSNKRLGSCLIYDTYIVAYIKGKGI